MKSDKLVTLKYYDTVLKAEIDMEVLKMNNIPCTRNENTLVGVFPIFDDRERGIELLVFEQQLEEAKALLHEYHSVEPEIAEN